MESIRDVPHYDVTEFQERRVPGDPLEPPWREAFVQAFASSWDAYGAWDVAVPGDKNLSKVKKRANARELMAGDPMVRIRLREVMAERITKIEFDAMTVVEALAEIAFFDPADAMTYDGAVLTVKSFDDMRPSARRAIQSLREKIDKATGERVVEVTFHNKVAALASLVDVLGLRKDRERRLLGHDSGVRQSQAESRALKYFMLSLSARKDRTRRVEDLKAEAMEAMEGEDE